MPCEYDPQRPKRNEFGKVTAEEVRPSRSSNCEEKSFKAVVKLETQEEGVECV